LKIVEKYFQIEIKLQNMITIFENHINQMI